jgi:FtsP/CotA-like multicopper oxidase with cupredoxin domain
LSGRQRAITVLAATAIAVGAFLALRPEDEDSQEPAGTERPAEPRITTPTETDPPPTAEPREPAVRLVRVRGGRPVGGVQTIEAEQGDTVRFRVQTETPQQIHLHGYDLYESTTAERPAEFRFKASRTGIFEIEIHATHTQIAELKVEP